MEVTTGWVILYLVGSLLAYGVTKGSLIKLNGIDVKKQNMYSMIEITSIVYALCSFMSLLLAIAIGLSGQSLGFRFTIPEELKK